MWNGAVRLRFIERMGAVGPASLDHHCGECENRRQVAAFGRAKVARFSHNRRGLYEIESNTLVGRVIGKGVTLSAGYTHDPQYSRGDFTIMEHRAREQVTFDNLGRPGTGQGERSVAARGALAPRTGRHGLARASLFEIFAAVDRQGGAELQQRDLPQFQPRPAFKSKAGSTGCEA